MPSQADRLFRAGGAVRAGMRPVMCGDYSRQPLPSLGFGAAWVLAGAWHHVGALWLGQEFKRVLRLCVKPGAL
jgi:hypothetical protein